MDPSGAGSPAAPSDAGSPAAPSDAGSAAAPSDAGSSAASSGARATLLEPAPEPHPAAGTPGPDLPADRQASGRRRPRRRRRRPGRDPRWAWALIALGSVLVLVSAGLIGTTRLLTHRYDSSVKKDILLADDVRTEPEGLGAGITGPLNFLLIGSDLRADSPGEGERSDTIIVVHVPATLDRAYLISIPRDLRVQIPPYPPTGYGGGRDKVNAAFQLGGGGRGGAQLLSMTLNGLLGIRFDGAAIVNFDGFRAVVKALGGVEMCIETRVVSEHVGFDSNGRYRHPRDGGQPVVYEPGCRELNDWQALDYVRQRSNLPDGDFGRQRHQQQFLRALFQRANEQGLATNPRRLDELVRAVAGSLTVDTNGIPLDELVFALRDLRPSGLTGVTLPSAVQWIGGTSYVIADPEAVHLYAAITSDTLDVWTVEHPTWVNAL